MSTSDQDFSVQTLETSAAEREWVWSVVDATDELLHKWKTVTRCKWSWRKLRGCLSFTVNRKRFIALKRTFGRRGKNMSNIQKISIHFHGWAYTHAYIWSERRNLVRYDIREWLWQSQESTTQLTLKSSWKMKKKKKTKIKKLSKTFTFFYNFNSTSPTRDSLVEYTQHFNSTHRSTYKLFSQVLSEIEL